MSSTVASFAEYIVDRLINVIKPDTVYFTAWTGSFYWRTYIGPILKNKVSRIVSSANKIIGRPQNQLTQLYVERTKKKTRVILADGSHPLFSLFELLKSGRRYRVPLAKNNVFKKSFIPNAIRIINSATFTWAVCKAWTVFFYTLYVYVTSYCVFICMLLFCCVGEPKIIFHLGGQ